MVSALPLTLLATLCLSPLCPWRGQAPTPGQPPLWGDLRPGPFAVGYRVEWARDRSRTWRITRRPNQAFIPDTAGRPVRICVWYPAAAGVRSPPMRLENYTYDDSPAAFADFARRLEQRDSTELTSMVQRFQVTTLLGFPMFALRGPPAAPGRFPLILVLGGLNAETTGQAVLAEFLASHGYIVAVVTWTGVNEDQFNAVRTQPGMEATVRDMEFAWSYLRSRSGVDPKRLAVMGHSLGGLIALLATMRNGNVGAAVGLDATYGFAATADVLTSFYGFAPRQMTAAFLDLRKAAGEQGVELDLRAEHGFVYSDRTFITIRNIRHSEFSTYALISTATHQPPIATQYITPGWTRESASIRYQQAIRMVLAFFDAKLKGDSTASTRLAAEVAASPGAVLTHELALPLPPPPLSPSELIALAQTKGFDSAAQAVDRYARENAPDDAVLDANAFNEMGYSLLGQRRVDDAIILFRLMLRAYPTSANSFDSYGDGLSAAGRIADACAAYARALALAPSDTTLSQGDRTALIEVETKRVGRGCPSAP